MRKSVFAAAVFFVVGACDAQQLPPPDHEIMHGIWNELKSRAKDGVAAIENYGRPRQIPRGAKPEIIIKGTQIFIDGKNISIGLPIDIWKKTIPGHARCISLRKSIRCDWDVLGITVMTDGDMVDVFTLHFNKADWGPYAEELPDGTPIRPSLDHRPAQTFPGYFEFDGYGIDSKTRFWEIRASVNAHRNLRCDLFGNCGSPHGRFSDDASLYLTLTNTSENGRLEEFTIAR